MISLWTYLSKVYLLWMCTCIFRKEKRQNICWILTLENEKWKTSLLCPPETLILFCHFLCIHWNANDAQKYITDRQMKLRNSILIIILFFLISFHLIRCLADDLPHVCFHLCINLTYSNQRTNDYFEPQLTYFCLWKKQYYYQKYVWIYVWQVTVASSPSCKLVQWLQCRSFWKSLLWQFIFFYGHLSHCSTFYYG